MFKSNELTGKVAVVTGGAQGIGRAIVELFSSHGIITHFFYHSSESAATELVSQCESKGHIAKAWKVDIRNKSECEKVIESIIDTEDKINILVNNSGVTRDGLLVSLSEEDLKLVFDTNITGMFNVTQAVTPHMMRQRAGKIINISSVSAEKGGIGQTNYAASKGAVNAFTKSLAVELSRRNITVNAISPGVIKTKMSEEVRDKAHDQVISEILLKRFGEAEDVANAALFFASNFSNYINGEILHVDGGFKM